MVEIGLCPECGRPRAMGHPCPSCAADAGRSPYSSDKKRGSGGGWSRRSPIRIILALLAFSALCYAFAWCAPLVVHLFKGAPITASPGGVTRYENPRGGFSFEYPASWVKLPYVSATGGSEVTPYAQVVFADPNGAAYNDLGMDFILVNAVKASVPFTEAMRPVLLPALQQHLASMAAQLPSLVVTEPPSEFTTDTGLRGVQAGYKASLEGQTVMEEVYIFPAGTMQYQIAVQAVEKHWQSNKPHFDAAVRSFQIVGT